MSPSTDDTTQPGSNGDTVGSVATDPPRSAVETDVPPDVDVVTCPYCDRPFVDVEVRALHLGLAHEPSLTAEERTAYEEALDAEEADLHRFRIIALGGLVALYFGFLFAYAVFA